MSAEGEAVSLPDPAAVGAFLTGIASVLSAAWALRRLRRLDEEECEKRFAAFREGLKLGKGDE